MENSLTYPENNERLSDYALILQVKGLKITSLTFKINFHSRYWWSLHPPHCWLHPQQSYTVKKKIKAASGKCRLIIYTNNIWRYNVSNSLWQMTKLTLFYIYPTVNKSHENTKRLSTCSSVAQYFSIPVPDLHVHLWLSVSSFLLRLWIFRDGSQINCIF